MESTVVIRDLTIGYRKHWRKEEGSRSKIVAGNINASIRQGELTCLLGP